MEADEIESSAGFAGGVVLLVRAVFKKGAKKFRGFWVSRTGGVGPANTSFGQSAQNGVDAEVVKLEEFFRRALPVVDVRLVPNFPEPRFDFGIAVTRAEVMNELKDEFSPFLIVLWRIRPAV